MWLQRELTLESRPRGFHLVTREVLSQLPELEQVGMVATVWGRLNELVQVRPAVDSVKCSGHLG
jgi:hypothetical protein